MNAEEQLMDTTLSQELFVDAFSEKLTDETGPVERQRVAMEIYNVLFGLNLSDFSKNQFLLLSTLLHSEDSLQSAEIFKEIVLLFPQIGNYIENIYKHKMILPKVDQNSENNKSQQNIFSSAFESPSQKTIHIYKKIQATLFDVFSIPEDYNHFQDAVRKGYIKHIQDTTQDDAQYLLNNVSMVQYNPLLGEMKLQLNSPKEYESFEKKYMPSLNIFLRKGLGYRFKKLEYNFLEETPLSNSPIHKEKVKNTPETLVVFSSIKETFNPRYVRDSYEGSQKEKVKDLLDKEKDNIFVGGNDNLGKSHLIQAVIKKLEKEGSEKKIIYTTGNKMYREIQNRFATDRQELTRAKKDKISQFVAAFAGVDVLVIDDIDAISSGSKSTHDIINQLSVFHGVQIVMLSKFSPAQIQRHTKYVLKEGGGDSIPTSLSEKFSPLLIEIPPVDKTVRKKIAKDIWEKNVLPNLFFTPKLVSGIIDFMSEHISPRIYQQLIKSIVINAEGCEKDISQKMYEIIENMTGEIILPQKDEIVDILVEEFNLDDIKQFFDISKMTCGKCSDLKKNALYTEKRVVPDSIEGVALRLCIYFIKKYYPKESLESIGEKFGRSNASSLYNEAKDWLKNEKQLESFFDSQIKKFLKKKYGLQHDI